MSVFTAPDFDGHERVVFAHDRETGLKAIVALHDRTLGPALGGCRMWPYGSDAEAIADVLRLSRGMTYKAAIAGVKLGGGKSVILGDSRTQKTPALLEAMGRVIDSLEGRYITGEDIGTNPDDMAVIKRTTRYVTCLRKADGGYGDPAPMTALGVFQAIRAGCDAALGSADPKGLTVAVQGVGNVGFNLCRLLHEAGARLVVSDVHAPSVERAVQAFGATAVDPEDILSVEADVLAPCARGAVLNDQSLPRLRARVIAGAANNQLAEDRHADALAARGILYLPDYVANGGGLVCVAAEWYRDPPEAVETKVRAIFETCKTILARATAEGLSTGAAADRIAEERVAAAKDAGT